MRVVRADFTRCYADIGVCLWTDGSELRKSAADRDCQRRDDSHLPRITSAGVQSKMEEFRAASGTLLNDSAFWVDISSSSLTSFHWTDNRTSRLRGSSAPLRLRLLYGINLKCNVALTRGQSDSAKAARMHQTHSWAAWQTDWRTDIANIGRNRLHLTHSMQPEKFLEHKEWNCPTIFDDTLRYFTLLWRCVTQRIGERQVYYVVARFVSCRPTPERTAAFAMATWLSVCVCHVDVLWPNDWVDRHATFTRL